jgi:hypothetical protein
MKLKISAFLFFVFLIAAGVLTFKFYPYIFSKTVQGRIIGVERVMDPSIIMGSAKTLPTEAFSFAIAIQSLVSREIHTASSEDRQWGVAKKGQCAEARLFRYPPWDLERGNTFFGARLLKLFDCPDAPPVAVEQAPAAGSVAPHHAPEVVSTPSPAPSSR